MATSYESVCAQVGNNSEQNHSEKQGCKRFKIGNKETSYAAI